MGSFAAALLQPHLPAVVYQGDPLPCRWGGADDFSDWSEESPAAGDSGDDDAGKPAGKVLPKFVQRIPGRKEAMKLLVRRLTPCLLPSCMPHCGVLGRRVCPPVGSKTTSSRCSPIKD